MSSLEGGGWRRRLTVGGLRLDMERDNRVWVLADPTAVRAAVALGARARREELVHATLVRRASAALAVEPLSTGEVWEAAARGVVPPSRSPAEATGAVATQVPTGPRCSSLGVARARPSDERRKLVEGVFADPDNGIWDVADRTNVLAAVDAFDELPMKPRRQLYGLATGAVWLAGG